MTPDEEPTYRATSEFPEGAKVFDDGDGRGVRVVTAEGEIVSLVDALQRRWLDTAPVHRRRARKADGGVTVVTAERPLIYERMAAVLAALPAVGKGKRNVDQGFNFRGIDDVMNALHECLSAQQVFYLPNTLERLSEARQTKSGAHLWVVNLHVAFTFFTVDGSNVTADTWGEGVDMADKATSKAHTFALKSCLLEAFNVATADMVDPDATGEESSPATVDPDEWYRDNGWKGGLSAYVTFREATLALLKAAPAGVGTAFKAWRESEGIGDFSKPHTFEHAQLIDAKVKALTAKEPGTGDAPPTSLPPPPESPSAGSEGNGSAGEPDKPVSGLRAHLGHEWVQSGSCVYCEDCSERLYQGSLPPGGADRDKFVAALEDIVHAATQKAAEDS